jgi:hypothetical protein
VPRPVLDGLPGDPLPAVGLGPGQSVRGTIGFLVPRSARGMVLRFDAQVGEDAAQLPLG